jgi:hypothetical protein
MLMYVIRNLKLKVTALLKEILGINLCYLGLSNGLLALLPKCKK